MEPPTTGPNLIGGILAHENLMDITRHPSDNKVINIGGNDSAAAAVITKIMATNLAVDSIEIDCGRHLKLVAWIN